MESFCWWLWGFILLFGVLFWRRYPPGHEFQRASVVMVALATCILPMLAIVDHIDANERAARAAAARQLEDLQHAWQDNHSASQHQTPDDLAR